MAIVRTTAPGRVNLLGEHTDYNGGFVLPAAIPQRTRIEIRRIGGRRVDAASATLAERRAYTLGEERPEHAWIDYVQGITAVLASAGHRLEGFELSLESDVPLGSGLSSSAALEIALLRALREAFDLRMTDEELARLGQRAENEFVGAPVGIMDQMASLFADERHALFLDTRTLAYERIRIPEAASIVVVNSGIAHRHAGGDYRTRRAECEAAAAALGVPQLRDVGVEDLARVGALRDPIRRRARHVITENARVLDAVAALHRADLPALGALFAASHASMRDDFEVSIPEIDVLVDIASALPGVYGARLTGGGFGGSIVALATPDSARETAGRIVEEYGRRTGQKASVLVPAPLA